MSTRGTTAKSGQTHNAHVVKARQGWQVRLSPDTTVSAHRTQAEAVTAARRAIRSVGGGNVVIHARNGRVRELDSVGSDGKLISRVRPPTETTRSTAKQSPMATAAMMGAAADVVESAAGALRGLRQCAEAASAFLAEAARITPIITEPDAINSLAVATSSADRLLAVTKPAERALERLVRVGRPTSLREANRVMKLAPEVLGDLGSFGAALDTAQNDIAAAIRSVQELLEARKAAMETQVTDTALDLSGSIGAVGTAVLDAQTLEAALSAERSRQSAQDQVSRSNASKNAE